MSRSKPARELAPDVGGVGREVRRRAVRADEHAVLVVAVGARPRPHARRPPRTCRAARSPPGSRPRPRSRAPRCRSGCGSARASPRSARASPARDRRRARPARRCSRRGSRPRAAPRRAGPRRPTRGSAPSARRRRCSSTRARPSCPANASSRATESPYAPFRAVRDGDRPGRVRRHHLHLDRARGVAAEPAPKASPASRISPSAVREPGVRDAEVDEARARRPRRARRARARRAARRSRPRSRAAAALLQPGEPQRDVRRVVAVRRRRPAARARPETPASSGERLLEARDGIDMRAGHAAILGGAAVGERALVVGLVRPAGRRALRSTLLRVTAAGAASRSRRIASIRAAPARSREPRARRCRPGRRGELRPRPWARRPARARRAASSSSGPLDDARRPMPDRRVRSRPELSAARAVVRRAGADPGVVARLRRLRRRVRL